MIRAEVPRALPIRGNGVLAGQPPRRQVKNNDPSLIEPIAAAG
jgi:hypothetical protein